MRKVFIPLVILGMMSCRPSPEVMLRRLNATVKSTYTIKKHKSKGSHFTGIRFITYDSLGEFTPWITVNKVDIKDNLVSLSKGRHTIEIYLVGKKGVKIKNLKVNWNDSIVIRTFLKDITVI